MKEEAPQRMLALREVFNGLRGIARTGALWRWMPHDLPPWHTVYQQTRRWLGAGVFAAIVHDLRRLLHKIEERAPEPRAAILDSRTLESSPENGVRAGYDGAKRRRGSKVRLAVDTLGHMPALLVTSANEQDRAQVAALAEQVQAATGEIVEVAFVDQSYTGARHPAGGGQAAPGQAWLRPAAQGWVVERSNAWLSRDYERLPETLPGLYVLAFAILMLTRFIALLAHCAEHALVSRAGDDDRKERFADVFAGHFLVPSVALRSVANTAPGGYIRDPFDVVRLRGYFRVSYATIVYRLRSEGLPTHDQY